MLLFSDFQIEMSLRLVLCTVPVFFLKYFSKQKVHVLNKELVLFVLLSLSYN